ncbi:exonuclease domain-containing protein [Rhizosaccharibacter radicis]|uniref:Exonuclease domain-containing protein n=1 Tax=Rhizosaccharibacter radicis TaxID=2782605 RepID=A0ABT1VXH2_9PROT|nr:exonuclease domain-containing protein [Acetobacteraceae bacterium KSS12]
MTPSEPIELLRVVDLETTGNSFTDGGVVEIGWQDLRRDRTGRWQLSGEPRAQLVRPGHPISSSTAAIHHIVDEDVADAPSWLEVAPAILEGRDADSGRLVALAAHRAAFEQRWCAGVAPRGIPWICTYKGALRVWPDEPGHSNQGLRYSRRPSGLDREKGLPAHRAGPDAYVTAHHLRDMLEAAPLEDLVEWSGEPALLVKMPFGPLRGRRFRDLDEDALGSLMRTDGHRATDIGFTVRQEMLRRGLGNATAAEAAGARDGGQAELGLRPGA